ncbi:membrane protein [Pyrenochaeta sp. MPI-SDFR-AT-0127]|nr:membrane protein [Pyrenochaeta sp. MPI-SDFR-AT-0127]
MVFNAMDESFNRWGRARWMSPRSFQYACGISGILSAIFFGGAFVVAGFIPPPRAHWDAERTVQFYRDHETRIHAGSAILVISGMWYLPLTAAMSAQMRRIPNLHYVVPALQLASGAAGIFTWMMPGIILSATAYRLDRPVEITQALNELFWLSALMPWPTFLIQNWAYSYAVIVDTRPKPLFPKWIAIVNIISPVLFTPPIAMHTIHSGAFSWAGGVSFWMVGIVFLIQLVCESFCVMRAVSNESEIGEMIIDMFPTTMPQDSPSTKSAIPNSV